MRLFKLFVAIGLTAAAMFASTAMARDLTGRLGVGFVNDFAIPVPAISVKYGLSKDLHWQGAMGFDTGDPAAFELGTKLYKNIFFETNLNFFMAGGLAYLRRSKSAFEVQGILGAEFFIPGLESLGFLFEAGVSANNMKTSSFSLSTLGYSFFNAGMHFYF